MNLISFARSLTRRVAAVAVVLSAATASQAADTPLPAAPAALVLPSSAPCTTCAAPASAPCGPACAGKMCPTCLPNRFRPAFQTKLCPGACFGYFQTQWSKWEDVCPLPYQGQGVSDAPAMRTSPVTPVRAPSGSDPKKTGDAKKDADAKKDTDPKFNKDAKDTKGSELPPPRTGGTTPMPMGRANPLPAIPQAPNTLPIPTGRFGS